MNYSSEKRKKIYLLAADILSNYEKNYCCHAMWEAMLELHGRPPYHTSDCPETIYFENNFPEFKLFGNDIVMWVTCNFGWFGSPNIANLEYRTNCMLLCAQMPDIEIEQKLN